MSGMAFLIMVVVAGILWGGFALCLGTALKKEQKKSRKSGE